MDKPVTWRSSAAIAVLMVLLGAAILTVVALAGRFAEAYPHAAEIAGRAVYAIGGLGILTAIVHGFRTDLFDGGEDSG